MKYDFETVLDRYDNGSVKWNLMKKKKPQVGRGVVPFSIADMEFKNPPEIIEALKEYLDTAVLGYQTAEPSWYEAVTGIGRSADMDGRQDRSGFIRLPGW